MNNYISCPNCGAEYTPSEIFIPRCFMGVTEYVKRDIAGKIQSVAGTDMDTTETFTCDYCKKTFEVFANVSFDTQTCGNIANDNTCVPYTERFKLKEF